MANSGTALAELATLVTTAMRSPAPQVGEAVKPVADRLDLGYGATSEEAEAALREALGLPATTEQAAAAAGKGAGA